jgi:branched-chain amino acid transport system permease protein
MIVQQLINGLSLGSIYALIALGYTLVYGTLRFINFAHGDVFMLGAFFGFYFNQFFLKVLGVSGPLSHLAVCVLAMVCCGGVGILIERLAYRPLRRQPKLTMLITAIGVSLFLEYGGQWLFGADPKPFPALIPDVPWLETPQMVLSTGPAIVMVVAMGLLLMLYTVVFHTKMGRAMRAVASNPKAASLMGVNPDYVIGFTFALGSVLAGAAGLLYASLYPSINPMMGIFPGLKAFVAAVVGGIGHMGGAVLGGFLIGLLETFVTGYLSPIYRDAITFGCLIVILVVKPSGLLGKSSIEKV